MRVLVADEAAGFCSHVRMGCGLLDLRLVVAVIVVLGTFIAQCAEELLDRSARL